jgi:hypothetical protein
MWNWFNCYLSGRHDYGIACEHGAIFLRCTHCGKQSAGWTVHAEVSNKAPLIPPPAATTAVISPRLLPFGRAAAR